LLQIEFGLAKKYSDDLGPTVMRGMHSKLQRGWWPGRAKLGYTNKKERGEVIQVVDEDRFPLLRKAIEAYLEGDTVGNILNNLNNKWGFRTPITARTGNLPLTFTSFYRVLKDPFYYGHMVWDGQEAALDVSVPRLVTEHEYWQVQAKLGARGVQRPHKHTGVPYRGLIKCSECGNTLVIYLKTKRLASGRIKTYYYAKCSSKKGCKQPHVSLGEIEKQLDQILAKVNISQDFHDWFVKWLKHDHQQETSETELMLQRIDTQIELHHKRRNNLLNLRIDGEVGEEDYRTKKDEINAEIAKLKKEQSNTEYHSNDWIKRAENRIHYARYAREKLANGNFEEKTSVLAGLGSNFLLDHRILRIDLDPVLSIFKNNHAVVTQQMPGRELTNTLQQQEDLEIPEQWWAIVDSL
jgi:site-specific DNA recombinase